MCSPCRLIYYSKSAVHVSGHVFAHHQEHLTVFTVAGQNPQRVVAPIEEEEEEEEEEVHIVGYLHSRK